MGLAFIVGTLGTFIPILVGGGFEVVHNVGWLLLFFPLYLFMIAFISGWWGFVAVPLLIVRCEGAARACGVERAEGSGFEGVELA